MKHVMLASVSVAALALGGCSMFDRSDASSKKSPATATSRPEYSGASQPKPEATQTSPSASHRPMNFGAKVSADEVREVQRKLKDDGDYMGQVDGKFGPQTAQAIKKFQKSNGLEQSGQLDQQTASKLGISTSAGSSVPTSSSSKNRLSTNSRSP
jgi:peptidoglycan hydrolase-like protein with peptidoglycan-binding domain